jgi:hypothetical protein
MRTLVLVIAGMGVLGVTRAAVAAPLLAVDINDRSTTETPDTVAGFDAFTMTGTTAASSAAESRVINGYTVTLQAFDDHLDEQNGTAGVQDGVGQIDDRDRATPTNSGSLTFAQIYDDFIFAGATTGPTGGMDLTINSGGQLAPNTQYQISIYSFDSGSTPLPQPRTAQWLDGNNGNALVTNTAFSGATLPTSDGQYKFTGVALTDASGNLLLKGRDTTGFEPTTAAAVSPGVFLNGFEINVVPEPASLGFVALGALGMARSRRRGLVR